MVLGKAVRQAPRLTRMFAPQQHQPLLSPKQSDPASLTIPQQSFENDHGTDFLLHSPPNQSPVHEHVPFFFDVRNDLETDERLDPARDCSRREEATERSYDFSSVITGRKLSDDDFAFVFDNLPAQDSSAAMKQGKVTPASLVSPTNTRASAPLVPTKNLLLSPREKDKDANTKVIQAITEKPLRETSGSESTSTTPTRTNKTILRKPTLTIITNPDDYLSDHSGSRPLSNCKPVGSTSFNGEVSPSACQLESNQNTAQQHLSVSNDHAAPTDHVKHETLDDKENDEDDTACLLSQKQSSFPPCGKGSPSDSSEADTDQLDDSPGTLSRLRLPKLRASKESKQSTPSERYDALISKLGSEQRRVELMHARLRIQVKSSSSDNEEKHSAIDTHCLANKTKEKVEKDPVLVFEPPQTNEKEDTASQAAAAAKGYLELESPSQPKVASSAPEWARARYLPLRRQQRLNRFRQANMNKTTTPTATIPRKLGIDINA